jgi:hypothetical protein
VNSDKTTQQLEHGMGFRMHMVVVPEGPRKWVNSKGNTECVEFVRQATGAPATMNWKPGQQVKTAVAGSIASFTAIATFDDKGNYPTDGLGRHAALYLSHDAAGIRVLDQWNAQGEVRERTIYFNRPEGTRRSNNGDTFYVIERR